MLRFVVVVFVSVFALLGEIPDECRKILDDPSYRYDLAVPKLLYAIRDGDRCEGSIKKPYSGNIETKLLSFTTTTPPAVSLTTAGLRWNRMDGKIQIAIASDQGISFYRMDTVQSAVEGTYQWSSDILQSLQLSSSQLYWLAWKSGPSSCGDTKSVYVPIHGPLDRENKYQLVLRAAVAAQEPVPRLLKDGIEVRGQAIKYSGGLVEPGRDFRLSIVEPLAAGRYRLDLSFQTMAREVGTACVEFLLP